MARRTTSLTWARNGAVLALLLSVAALVLPAGLGGYHGWNDTHLVIYNLSAILTRVAVFASLGGVLGDFWSRRRHRRYARTGGHA
jgi:hypothetical protein